MAEITYNGTGTEQDPILIETVEQWMDTRTVTEGGWRAKTEAEKNYVKLCIDIDYNNIPTAAGGIIGDTLNLTVVFADYSIFEGDNHDIRNIVVKGWNSNYSGFLRFYEVYNLNVPNFIVFPSVTSSYFALFSLTNRKAVNCNISSYINGTQEYPYFLGTSSYITKCYNCTFNVSGYSASYPPSFSKFRYVSLYDCHVHIDNGIWVASMGRQPFISAQLFSNCLIDGTIKTTSDDYRNNYEREVISSSSSSNNTLVDITSDMKIYDYARDGFYINKSGLTHPDNDLTSSNFYTEEQLKSSEVLHNAGFIFVEADE